jgi:hypothetical protein
MALQNIGIDLFKSIIKESKENPDLLDSYSLNQFKSKENLLGHIESLKLNQPNVTILASWFGSILVPALTKEANHIYCIDIDDRVISVGKRRLFTMYNNISWSSRNIWDEKIKSWIEKADLIINTSCEHMSNMRELPALYKSNAYFAFQSNNMFDIEGHINCCYSIEQFAAQLPRNATIIQTDQIEDDRGIRYTLIGKLCAE